MSIFFRKSYVDSKKNFFQKRYILFFSLLSVFSSHGIWLPTYQSIKDMLGFGKAAKNTEIVAYTDDFETNRRNFLPITLEELQKDQALQEQQVKQKAAENLKVIQEYIPHYSSILEYPTYQNYIENVLTDETDQKTLSEPVVSAYQIEKMNIEKMNQKNKPESMSNIKHTYDNIQTRLKPRGRALVDTTPLIYDYDSQVERLNRLNNSAQDARGLRERLTRDYLIEVSPEHVSGTPVLSLKSKDSTYQTSPYTQDQINGLKKDAVEAAYNALGKDDLDRQYTKQPGFSREDRVLAALTSKSSKTSVDAYSKLVTNPQFINAYNNFRTADQIKNDADEVISFGSAKWQDALDKARASYKSEKAKKSFDTGNIPYQMPYKFVPFSNDAQLPSGLPKKMRYQTSPLNEGVEVVYHDDGMIRPSLANKYAINSWTTNEELAQQEDNFKRISMIQEMNNNYKRRKQEQIIAAQKKAEELAKNDSYLTEVD